MGRESIGVDRVSRKRKISCFAAGLRLKIRKSYADESNAFGRREYRSDQAEDDLVKLLLRLDRHLHRPAPGGNLKAGPFDLDRDGPAASVRFLAPRPDGSGANGRIWPAMMSAELPEGWAWAS
jgi:hypothetical protein